ncbi:MAG: rRNA adenine N-6-methyltransferase family protein [bacterium]|nr:rRNA adenine N-6-methyltransferase family protein [bacterium]
MLEQLNFFKVAFLDSQIGALTRSSKYVVNAVVRQFDGRALRRVVEYGPGDGVLTMEILKRMPEDGELIVVETNPKFLKVLKNIEDSRLKIIKGTAQEASRELSRRNEATIDLVVSSIPFSILKSLEREKIVGDTFAMLKSTGKFIVFHQYSPLMLGLLNKYFNKDAVNTQFELRNIPPCFIMSAQK